MAEGCENPKVKGRGKRFCSEHPPMFPSNMSYWRDPERHKKRVRDNELMKKYGLTREDYEVLKKKPCEICGERTSRMHVDHIENGKMRGWLCNKCNPALGLFKDSSALLKAAVEYLERGA